MTRNQKYVVVVNYLEALAQGVGNPDEFMDTLAMRGWDIAPAEDLLVKAELLANEYAAAGASKDEFDIQFYCIAKAIAEKI